MTPKSKGRGAATSGGRQAPKKEKLTDKQALFAAEYVVDWNATQAAIRAGYSAKNADKIGSELLGKTRVRAAIEKAKANALERAGVRAERVVLELAKLSFASVGDILMVDDSGNVVMRSGDDIPRAALDAVSAISATDAETVTERESKSGSSSTRTRTRTINLKLHDKRASLVDLGRYLQIFKDDGGSATPTGLPDKTGLEHLTPEEVRLHLNRLLKEDLT